MTESNVPVPPLQPRFCDRCGLSLIPLDRPHVIRPCPECGKSVHTVEVGEGGTGIKIRAGDRFVIPAGFLKVSLDPTVGTKLFRPGLRFLLKGLFYAGQPKDAQALSGLIEHYRNAADTTLKASPLLQGLDIDSEADSKEVWDRVSKDKDSREWFAALMGTFAGILEDALKEGDLEKAAWAAYHAATAHSMVTVLEPVFEQTLWRGYLANQVVYETAVAAAKTPAEAEALRLLQPRFESLDEATLHTWVNDGRPIGLRLGVSQIPEATLKALAQFHLASFARRREQQEHDANERSERKELRVKWAGWGVAAATLLLAALKAIGIL